MFTPPLSNKSLKSTKSHAQDSIPSFIRKTYDILEENKFPEIIDWNQEGTALVIKKPSDFCQKVLPLYFKHNNLTSFVRQLNMYNFHKRRTQNIDHVYAHELFQRGKKHLLKEIRRKNHEANNNSANGSYAQTPLRLPDTLDTTQNPPDMNTIMYENQFLKRLYNDAMSKLAQLEGQVNELSSQNKNLWSQLCQKNPAPVSVANDKENKPQEPIMIQREQSELTLDKLPMTCGGIAIPPLKLNMAKGLTNSIPTNGLAIAKHPSMNVNCFLNLGEESTEPCESSFTSPSVQTGAENDNVQVEFSSYQMPPIYKTSHTGQIQYLRSNNDLKITKDNMSIGQLLDAWNVEVPTEYNSILGKREMSLSGNPFDNLEPSLRKNPFDIQDSTNIKRELSIFNKKSFFSNLSSGLFNVNDDFGGDELITFTN